MTLENQIVRLQFEIAPLRAALLQHALYGEMRSLPALRRFMQHHVFAVWDFMSLLKALQRQFCCVDVPWLPPPQADVARFINEIVLGEESDLDTAGQPASHFDLYWRSMQQCGASTETIDRFLLRLRRGDPVSTALMAAEVPPAASRFVSTTFSVIETGEPWAIAAAFTYGREDLLPAVFQRLVEELDQNSSGQLAGFLYYLRRHIELDGDSHGPIATRLLASLCGNDETRWQRAISAAHDSLRARLQLWDGMLAAIRNLNHEAPPEKTLSTAR